MILDGQVALITGAGTGIGRAVAARFTELGAQVGLIGRRVDVLDEVAAATGGIALPCDVSDTDQVDTAVERLVERCGGVDIVVNNAAVAKRGSVEQLDDDTWGQMLDINLSGLFRVARATVPVLRARGGGAIVNVSSVGGLFAAPESIAYSATKSAILGFTRSLARDHGKDGIRANTVCPGWVDTDMAEPAVARIAGAHGIGTEDAKSRLTRFNPIQGMIEPEAVARCIEFLATDASSCVTGTVLMADNGQSIVDVGVIPMSLAREASG